LSESISGKLFLWNQNTLQILFSLILILILTTCVFAKDNPELEFFNKIKNSRDRKETAEKLSAQFLKNFPDSVYVPDVKMVLADIDTLPSSALKKYRTVIDKYKYYKKKDMAYLKICEILHIQSKWNELSLISAEALKKYPQSAYADSFRIFSVLSLLNLGRYDEADRECRILNNENHGYEELASSLIIMSYILKNETGHSKEYFSILTELANGFSSSKNHSSILYLLAEFYESKKNFDRAFSAYSDIIGLYPKSPEASMAADKIKKIQKYNPKKTSYLPESNYADDSGSIDIKPEIDIDNADAESYYSVSITGFSDKNEALEIKKITDKIGESITVKVKNGYSIYIGKFSTQDEVITAKVRLAEEYGINGNIVRISGGKEKRYIYGE
jgi:tetratricopeptide (TPR) repeat protein